MTRRAIVLGIDQYENLPDLSYASLDAREFATALREPEACCAEINVLSASGQNQLISKLSLLKTIQVTADQARPEDELILYYAGHGFVVDSDADRRVFLAVPETSAHSNLISESAVDLEIVIGILKGSHAKHVLLIIDACRVLVRGRSTTILDTRGFPAAFRETVEATMQEAKSQKTWEIISSCRDEQFALESPEYSGGVWTHCFLKAVEDNLSALRAGNAVSASIEALAHDAEERLSIIGEEQGAEQQAWRFSSGDSLVLLQVVDEPQSGTIALLRAPGIKSFGSNEPKLSTEDRREWKPMVDSGVIYRDETMHLVPFHSHSDRPDLKSVLDPRIESANREFLIRLFLPNLRRFRPPFERVFVMLNGLAESNSKVFDEVALGLARIGIPSILLPLPRHFTRFVQLEEHEDPFRPEKELERLYSLQLLQSIHAHPEYIVHGFEQIDSDARQLVGRIQDRDDQSFSGLFSSRSRVSLFGYSIGGLYSLGVLLNEFQVQSKRVTQGEVPPYLMSPSDIARACDGMAFSCAFLLESGAPIDQIDTAKLFFRHESVSKRLWHWYVDSPYAQENQKFVDAGIETLFSERELDQRSVFEEMVRNREYGDSASYNPDTLFLRSHSEAEKIWHDVMLEVHRLTNDLLRKDQANLFRRVFLGDHPIMYKAQLDALSRRILVITGGADEIFPASLLLSGPTSVLATLQVPGISHWLKAGAEAHWTYWRQLVVDLVVGFERTALGKRNRA